jgi:predicted deacylase
MAAITKDLLFGLTEPLPTKGQHTGFVKIPHSSNRSAYGIVPLPLTVVGGGAGPTVLLQAGIFGDELDAQIAVTRIMGALDPAKMNGRVIALPMANFPAAQAGTRNSPLDGRSLNKSFPGDVFGTPTSVIADYIERNLMPVSDLVIDLHSVGRTMRYMPSVTLIDHSDPDVQMRRLALARAFGLDTVLRFHSFEDRSTSGSARRAGATRIGVEAGETDPVGTIVGGVRRVLDWAGVTGPAGSVSAQRARVLVTQWDEGFVYALCDGVFQPAVQLGDSVAAGDVAGHIHDLGRPLAEPVAVRFSAGGIVVCTRGSSQTSRGDCLMHLATEADGEALAQFGAAASLRWLGSPGKAAPKRRRPKRKTG